MHKIIISGIGTDVGKTVVSAIFTTLLNGDYWKPIECGDEKKSDSRQMVDLIDTARHHIHPSAYSLKAHFSPHHAARLEGVTIDMESIIPPETTRPLVIESVGGIFVPLTMNLLSFDLFRSWDCRWVIVSKHYLGSINHTLLTIDSLKQRQIAISGLIFNGEPNPDSESVIQEISQLPILGRLLPEQNINSQIIQRYAKLWKHSL